MTAEDDLNEIWHLAKTHFPDCRVCFPTPRRKPSKALRVCQDARLYFWRIKELIEAQREQIIKYDKELATLREFINKQCTNEQDPVKCLVNILLRIAKIETRLKRG